MILKRNYLSIISILALFTILLNFNNGSVYGQPSNAPFVTEDELEAALDDVVTQEDLEAALADVVTQEQLQQVLNQIEECPAGTIYEGFFVNGDGDPNTTVPEDEVMTEICIPTAQLNVIKTTTCDVEEFGQEFCDSIREPKISVLGNNPIPSFFFGTEPSGTSVSLGPGAYHVDEAGFTEGLEPCKKMGFDGGRNLGDSISICTNFSDECQGDITIGNPQTCTIDNVLVFCEVTVDTITGVGADGGLVYDPVHKRMYEADYLAGTVSIIDTNTNTVDPNKIPVGLGPSFLAYDPIHQDIYVTNQGLAGQVDNTVSVIDTNTNNVVDTIPVGNNPVGITYDSVNKRMYVANGGAGSGNTVSVIDTTTNDVIATIPVGVNPSFLAFDPITLNMYVTNAGSNTVSVIDTTSNTVIDTITVGNNPYGIAYDSFHKRMYVANRGEGTVSVIDTTTNMVIGSKIPVGSVPQSLAYDPINHDIYVTNTGSDTVSVIDTTLNTVIDTIPVGDEPRDVAYDSFHERMYVNNGVSNTVSVINLC